MIRDKSNSIGNTENDIYRRKALFNLQDAFTIEQEKKALGYVWIKNGKTEMFIHPEKVEMYLEKGFKII